MKKIFLIGIVLMLLAPYAAARDFIVEYVQENYKETQARFSYSPLIYHSIQVNSAVGPKVIILKGDDYNYRRWIRQYIAENRQLILRIKTENTDAFMSAKAYELDIHAVHPVDIKKWSGPDMAKGQMEMLSGSNYILVVDKNKKRSDLVKTIVEKMGFQVLIASDDHQALNPFKMQPEKFALIIAHHLMIEQSSDSLIDQILKVDHNIPIILDPGYKNKELKQDYTAKYRNTPSVVIKPLMLQNLSKTIVRLISGNA